MQRDRADRDTSRYSLTIRRRAMIGCAVLFIGGLVVFLLQWKGLIDVEEFGYSEKYLYIGALGVMFVGLIATFIIRRCPGCSAYLGRDGNPSRCQKCGAIFE